MTLEPWELSMTLLPVNRHCWWSEFSIASSMKKFSPLWLSSGNCRQTLTIESPLLSIPNHGERSQWPVEQRHCQSRSQMIAGREKKGRVNYSRNSAMSTSCRVRMIFWKPEIDNDQNQLPCYLKNNPHPMKNSPRLSTGGGELCYSPIKTSVGDSW